MMRRFLILIMSFGLVSSVLAELSDSQKERQERYQAEVSEYIKVGMFFDELQKEVYERHGVFMKIGIMDSDTIRTSFLLESRTVGIFKSDAYYCAIRLNKIGRVKSFNVVVYERTL